MARRIGDFWTDGRFSAFEFAFLLMVADGLIMLGAREWRSNGATILISLPRKRLRYNYLLVRFELC